MTVENNTNSAPESTEPTQTGMVSGLATATSDLVFSGPGEPVAEAAPEAVFRPRGRLDRFGVAMGTGRRKTAVARVRIQSGSGKFTVNERPMEEFFCIERDRKLVCAPLEMSDKLGKVDVWVRVTGGGTTGQAGAIVLGIARALETINPSLHAALGDHGFLTRDSRMVERKKYGFKKARRSFQFSKR
jgi:small subunit ribosomal protein S9